MSIVGIYEMVDMEPAIVDSPTRYLDCTGKFLALFHLFDSLEAKEKALEIINPLSEAFPVRKMFDCKEQAEAPKK